MSNEVKVNNPIYIGDDGKGNPLIQINIIPVAGGGYRVEPKILGEVTEASKNLRDNLEKLLRVKADNKGNIQLNIIAKNNKDEITTRCLGTINHKRFNPNVELTTLEIKMLSLGMEGNDYDRVFANSEEIPTPHTDLHTHYTGQLTAKEVYDIAMKTNPNEVTFKVADLIKNKIVPQGMFQDESQYVPLSQLDKIEGVREKLLESMTINRQGQVSFLDMDDRYKQRNPFFDPADENLIKNYILQIAKNYASKGVKYCELSVSPWIFNGSPNLKTGEYKERENRHKYFLKAVQEAKKKYGVDVAFLLATPRVNRSKEALEAFTKSFIDEIDYPIVSGIDLLGHEITSNKDYTYLFASAAKMCATHELSNYTIRCHAGESAEYEDNVKIFLQSVKSEIDALKKKGIPANKDFFPNLRIGHGLHGVLNDETLKLIKDTGAIIEINASSNMSLNNITELKQIPIKKYLDLGIRVVLGTDGAGLYGTDSRQEAYIAHQLGVSVEQLRDMVNFEDKYISSKLKEAKRREGLTNVNDYTYSPETVDKIGVEGAKSAREINEIQDRVDKICLKIEEQMKKDNPIFVCGMEKKSKDEEKNKLVEDYVRAIVGKIKEDNNHNGICIYDNNSYINELVEQECKREGVKVIKIKSLDNIKDESQSYGTNKYDVARKVARYCKDNNTETFILGGDTFASEVAMQCDNYGQVWKTDTNIPGASQEQAKLRNKITEMDEKREKQQIEYIQSQEEDKKNSR